jgi:hypothetical protein
MSDRLRRTAGFFGVVATAGLATTIYSGSEVGAPSYLLLIWSVFVILQLVSIGMFSVSSSPRLGMLFAVLFGYWAIFGAINFPGSMDFWPPLPWDSLLVFLAREYWESLANLLAFGLGISALVTLRGMKRTPPAA